MATQKATKVAPVDNRKRIRLALSPSPELLAVLAELAEAVGKSPSGVAAELLTEMIPQMQGLTKVAQAAKSGNRAAAKRALVHMVGDSMAEIMRMQQPELFGGKK